MAYFEELAHEVVAESVEEKLLREGKLGNVDS